MPKQESDYLYRIVPFVHALELFETKELRLALPSAWEDPFETLLSHSRSHALFAQCWCKKSVSAAMWQVYSPDRKSVRLRTTRAKLQALADSQDQSALSLWIRDVSYKTPSQVRKALLLLKQQLGDHYTVEGAAEALFLKRDAFDYENEVRLVAHDGDIPARAPISTALRLKVEPHTLIESIMFDPRVDPDFYAQSKERLETVVGFKGSIGKSALYRSQKQLLVD